jgi:hypothetical protein
MDHPLKRRLEGRIHRRPVGEIGAQEAPRRPGLRRDAVELGQPRLLEGHVVIIVDVVEAGHRIAARQQPRRDMEADEAGGAGDEDVHD